VEVMSQMLKSSSALGFPGSRRYNGAQRKAVAPNGDLRRLRSLSSTYPKPDPDEITQDQLNLLLDWLDPDREKAGIRYEQIRRRLVKIFVCRASNVPEELADKTINRVARKLPEIRATYVGDPAHYFAGVAVNILRETVRKDRIPAIGMPESSPATDDREKDYSCLEKCMEKLDPGDRSLVLDYYREEGQAKIDNRRQLAEQLGIGLNALRIRACRIRSDLQACMEKCRAEGAEFAK
jgi:DNA-directed RNA polymerase specialized sigma24 family protein